MSRLDWFQKNSILSDHLAKISTHIFPQPSYLPDLAPYDLWLFNKLKRPLQGHSFESIEEIQRDSLRALQAISEKHNSDCFEDWKETLA